MANRRRATIHVEVHLSAERVRAVLLGSVATLVGLSLLGALSAKVFGHDSLHGLIPRLDLGEEMSLPTWFSSALLLSIGLLFAVIALLKRHERDRFAPHWSGLAAVFALMSMEEVADFHNVHLLSDAAAARVSPYLHHSWVILGAVCVVVLAAAYARFLLGLPRPTAAWMLLSGVVYFVGAIGFEMVSGRIVALGGRGSWALVFACTAEETLEMVGAVMLMVTLLRYIDATYGRAALRFTLAGADGDSAGDRTWLAGTITPVATPALAVSACGPALPAFVPVPPGSQTTVSPAASSPAAVPLPVIAGPAEVPARRATGE